MEKISKERVKKRMSGEAYDINKQMTYIVPKSKIESSAYYAPVPAAGHRSIRKQVLSETFFPDNF